MRTFNICLSFVLLAAVCEARPDGLPPPTAIETGTEDENCIELEALKEYYCNTQKCKDFYTKTCYEEGKPRPACAEVKKCMEDRIKHYKDKAEKRLPGNLSNKFTVSCPVLFSLVAFSVVKSFVPI